MQKIQELCFATNNHHKADEVGAKVQDRFIIRTLGDIGCDADIPETADTLEGNALMKARYVWQHYHIDCFADDTGLEVASLGGRPGVHTARFAGPGKDDDANVDKLLSCLEGVADRRACFRTVIALILGGREYLFEGRASGQITGSRLGDGGFGYDPVFLPDGFDKTFAQLPLQVKNQIGHRGRALAKLISFLNA